MLVAQVLTVLATSIAAISVARILEPGDWAVFSAFLGLSLALAIVADFGLATWLLREFSRLAASSAADPATMVGRSISGALIVNVAIAVPLWAGALVWGAVARPEVATLLTLLALLAYGTMTASGSAMEMYLRSLRQVRLVVGVSILEKSLLLAALFVVAVIDGGLVGIGVAYLAAGLTRIGVDAYVVFHRRRIPARRPRRRELRQIVTSSVPFALTSGSLNVVPRLDTFLLVTVSTSAAAWYAVGERILGPALLIPATLGTTLFPFFASTPRRTPPWKVSAAMGAAGLALALIGVVLSPIVVPLLFGSAYDDAVPVTQIMLLVAPIVYATSPLLVSAYSYGAERRLVVPAIAIALFGSAAILAGQWLAGPKGAAAGLLLRSLLFLFFVGSVALSASNDVGASKSGTIGDPSMT
jgi:O-antigen/teichoic acid export membrane protein